MRWVRIAVIGVGLSVGLCGMAAGWLHAVLVSPTSPDRPLVVPSAVLAGVSSADAKQLRDFYTAMADIVVRDGLAKIPLCKTTFDLRNRHRQALETAFANTSMVGKYEGLGQRLDEYLLATIGRLDIPLTTDVRKAAAKAFSDIK
jgi:hypothetical protein